MPDLVVESPPGSLAVRDHGGSGPAVLLLHGAGHNLEVWRDVVAAIDGRCRVVAVDLRGHGQSSVVESFTMADLVTDTHRICMKLQLADPVVAGHSLGGWVALAAASLGGIRTIVTIEGPVLDLARLFRELGLPPDRGAGGEDTIRAAAFQGDDAAWAERLMRKGPPGSIARAVAERGGVRRGDGLLHAHPLPAELIAAQRCAWEIDPAALYRGLGIPATVVLGTQQAEVMGAEQFVRIRSAAADDLARSVPGLRVVRTTGGHHLPVDRPREIAEIIVTAVAP
jgi:pimeloyl-ACP methyl ester carboxylesterase